MKQKTSIDNLRTMSKLRLFNRKKVGELLTILYGLLLFSFVPRGSKIQQKLVFYLKKKIL